MVIYPTSHSSQVSSLSDYMLGSNHHALGENRKYTALILKQILSNDKKHPESGFYCFSTYQRGKRPANASCRRVLAGGANGDEHTAEISQ